MVANDSIADMLTRIRNGAKAGHVEVAMPYSKLKEEVARIMSKEGFVKGVDVVGEHKNKALVVELKYKPEGGPVFNSMQRKSKLSRRFYVSASDIHPNRQGVGVAILTTSKGVMKDVDAKKQGVGGEVLCTIW